MCYVSCLLVCICVYYTAVYSRHSNFISELLLYVIDNSYFLSGSFGKSTRPTSYNLCSLGTLINPSSEGFICMMNIFLIASTTRCYYRITIIIFKFEWHESLIRLRRTLTISSFNISKKILQHRHFLKYLA